MPQVRVLLLDANLGPNGRLDGFPFRLAPPDGIFAAQKTKTESKSLFITLRFWVIVYLTRTELVPQIRGLLLDASLGEKNR